MKINFILTGEGSSDLRMVSHIENILILEGFSEVRGESPDLSRFQRPVGRTVADKLKAILKLYPSADIIFVHRDADNAGKEAREKEIQQAQEDLSEDCTATILPLIPVKMIETWLLCDQAAINAIAGSKNRERRIECLPSIRQLERIANTKDKLLEALCEASGTQGGKLKEFKRRFSEMRARLMEDLDPEGKVNDLDSYQAFRNLIRNFSQQRLAEQTA